MSSRNIRTYQKRPGLKRKFTEEHQKSDASGSTTISSPSKRIKRSETPKPARTPPAQDLETDVERTPPRKPKVIITYGSPRKNTPIASTNSPASEARTPAKPSPLARDLSGIFDEIMPSMSPSASPTKIARRMLGRSKTESSIESLPSSRENLIDRTPSLPNLPSSPLGSPADVASTLKNLPSLVPVVASSFKPPTTRTYAGQYRSFLVPLPASSLSDRKSENIQEDEGFDAKESYNSLRTRWGVDNSEDDPYPYISPSPTKSLSATPDASPSKPGKGKAKLTSITKPLAITNSTMNPLKSISELRNKGESRRFLDEVGYLLEGMDKNAGVGLRRASALEITTKLCDTEFTRKAKAADFFATTWDVFLDAGCGKSEDKILDSLLVFYAALVARDPSSLSDLAQRSPTTPPLSPINSRGKSDVNDLEYQSLVTTLFNLLGKSTPETDLIALANPNATNDDKWKKLGINKKDRLTLTTLYKVISLKSNLFYADTHISTPLLISYTLQSLPPAIISIQHFPTLFSSLKRSLTSGSSTSLANCLKLNWFDAAKAMPYENVYYHLRLYDRYLLDQWGRFTTFAENDRSSQTDDHWREANEVAMNGVMELADDLVSLVICIEIHDDSKSVSLQKCLDTIFRVLVSLTHANDQWARKVVENGYTMGFLMRTIYKAGQDFQWSEAKIEAEEEVKIEQQDDASSEDAEPNGVINGPLALDTLCLCLGLLTNLVQSVDEAKKIVGEISLNPSCKLKNKECTLQCHCSQGLSGIEILVNLYSQLIKTESVADPLAADSPEARAEADASFIRGHLSILFGLLMMGSPENHSAILYALPSLPSHSKKAKLAQHVKLSRLADQAKDFTAFYSVVSRDLGGDNESKIAKEVVRFLEIQRDLSLQ